MDHVEDPELYPARCRDPNARRLILDAVRCHQAGAQRAAIVSVWVAVVYDIFGKVRELAQSGDRAATAYIKELDRAVDTHEVASSQKIESSILDDARGKFDLLSANEHLDLSRLHEDRHRCAHPSMNRPEEAYSPVPELVRLHLRNAVTHLLSQPPVQGKAALEQLQREVDSELFPKTATEAADYLRGGIYRRMKPTLLRGFCRAIVASCLTDASRMLFTRRVRGVVALRSLHHEVVSEALKEQLTVAARRVPDEKFHRVVMFLGSIPDAYAYLESDVRLRAETYIANISAGDVTKTIPYALAIPELSKEARARIAELERSDLEDLLARHGEEELVRPTAPEILDRVVDLYVLSRSWDNSDRVASKLLIPSAQAMSASQVNRVLAAFTVNLEVYNASSRKRVLAALLASGKTEAALLDAALAKCEMTRADLVVDD